MSPIFLCSVVLLCTGLVATSVSVNKTDTKPNVIAVKERSGRWYNGESKPKSSVPLGYYASPDSPVYSIDHTDDDDDESRNDKAKYNLPTSFADFKPDSKQSQYNFQKGPSPPSAWKGYSASDMDFPSPWMFPPTEMAAMISAMKGDEPTGLLAKLKAEPIAILLAVVLPISILLAAVLPSLVNYFMNGNQGTPTITTAATGSGDGTRQLKSDNPSFVASVLDAIEGFGSKSLNGSSGCLQRKICEVSKKIAGTELRAIQRNIFEAMPSIDDSWLQIFGLKELKQALKSGNCKIIQCIDGTEKKRSKKNENVSSVKKS